MPDDSLHLTEPLLDLAAEDELPPAERAGALAHLDACPRCAAEVGERRALLVSLEALARFAPSAAFADAVMARVSLAPRTSASLLRRWLPQTSRGWMGVLAALLVPLAPLVALVAWVLSRPLVTAAGLWSWGTHWAREAVWTGALRFVDTLLATGALTWLDALVRIAGVAARQVGPAGIAAALLVPLAGWLLVRLSRTPTGNSLHA